MISGILQKLQTALTKDKITRDTYSSKKWLKIVLSSSFGVTALVWGVRELKWLQSWELKAYDQMLRSRPTKPRDNRILLVTITQQDLARYQWPLSDKTVNQLLQKLESYQPRVIALNVYRPEQKNLTAGLANPQNIIATCAKSTIGRPEIPPPANLSIDNLGFNDLIPDNENDQIVRRALLFSHSADKKCKTDFSFAALAAISYLEKAGLELDFPDQQHLSIGKTMIPILTSNFGGYENLDAQGYQILLNYRQPDNFAEEVSLTAVLKIKLNQNKLKTV